MGRFVEPRRLPEPSGKGKATSQVTASNGGVGERIVKYVPVEIVSGYVFVLGLTQAIPNESLHIAAAWLCFVVGAVATPVYLLRQKPSPEQLPQVWIATVAFPLWAYLLGGPFALPPLDRYYSAAFGSVIVGLYTWLVGLFYVPKATAAGGATS